MIPKLTARTLLSACLAGGFLAAASAAPPTAEQMKALLKSRPEIDEIRWKDPARGAAFTVRVLEASPAGGVTVEKRLASGLTLRKLPLGDIGFIRFGATPRETELHETPEAAAAPALGVLWEARKATIALPGSNAGETGIAFAKALRANASSDSFAQASAVLDFVLAKEPLETRLALAKAERQTLEFVQTRQRGNAEETDRIARQIAESAGGPNSEAVLLATAWLSDRHFSRLKAIEEDNPRWIEDSEVKPERDRLYHLALDFALYPSLFESRAAAEAAAGLARAARIHQFARDDASLQGVLEDLAALYPDSPESRETAPLLASLQQAGAARKPSPSSSGTDAGDDAAPAEETPAAPPPAKRHSLFED